jgi:hypothetical protein
VTPESNPMSKQVLKFTVKTVPLAERVLAVLHEKEKVIDE